MIKGLAITPPVIGRISIGKLVQKQERWLPEKDDSFSHHPGTESGWLVAASLAPGPVGAGTERQDPRHSDPAAVQRQRAEPACRIQCLRPE
jgi:hypothetical protein